MLSLIPVILSSYYDLIKIKLGFKKEEQFVKDRKAICNGCEFVKKVLGINVCGDCSCVIQAKSVKIYSRCPKNKWQE